MKPITPEQLKCLNTLVSKLGINKQMKEDMVVGFSGGKASSSKYLLFDEAAAMIKNLKELDIEEPSLEKMRKKVFALAYVANMIWGETPADKKMNAAKLDRFLREKGAVRKSLNSMNKNDLHKVVGQFAEIVKHQQQTGANKATRSLLSELDLTVLR
jgi:hypothetical protein